MNHQLLALFGLKWNPFSADVPVEALWRSPQLDHFCWRMESLVREGGFALVTGDPGTGKSVSLRLLAQHLGAIPEAQTRVLTRPQSAMSDFYRELGQLFGVPLIPHNRWAGFKGLRQTWLNYLDSSLLRPVLLIDEAQEIPSAVLAELRILTSTDFDSRSILTVVLTGDSRLTQQFRSEELLPIASRIRVRLTLDYLSPKQLLDWLNHALEQAGATQLMNTEVKTTLTEHAAGNFRILTTMANDLLATAARRGIQQIDQKLYLEVFAAPTRQRGKSSAAQAHPER
jgi:general secretion pathway protein A